MATRAQLIQEFTARHQAKFLALLVGGQPLSEPNATGTDVINNTANADVLINGMLDTIADADQATDGNNVQDAIGHVFIPGGVLPANVSAHLLDNNGFLPPNAVNHTGTLQTANIRNGQQELKDMISEARIDVLCRALPGLQTWLAHATHGAARLAQLTANLGAWTAVEWKERKQLIISNMADGDVVQALGNQIPRINTGIYGAAITAVANNPGQTEILATAVPALAGQARVLELERLFPLLKDVFAANRVLRNDAAKGLKILDKLQWRNYVQNLLAKTADLNYDGTRPEDSTNLFATYLLENNSGIALAFQAGRNYATRKIEGDDTKNAIGQARVAELERLLPQLETFFSTNPGIIRALAVTRITAWSQSDWRLYKQSILENTAKLNTTNPDAFVTHILGQPVLNSLPYNITGQLITVGANLGQMSQADAKAAIGQARVAVLEAAIPKLQAFFTANPDRRKNAAALLQAWTPIQWLARQQRIITKAANLDPNTPNVFITEILGHVNNRAYRLTNTGMNVGNITANTDQMSLDDAKVAIGQARVTALEYRLPKLKIFFRDNPTLREKAATRMQAWTKAQWLNYQQQIFTTAADIDPGTTLAPRLAAAADEFAKLVLGNEGKNAFCILDQKIEIAPATLGKMAQVDAIDSIGDARVAELELLLPTIGIFFLAHNKERRDAAARLKNWSQEEWRFYKHEILEKTANLDVANPDVFATHIMGDNNDPTTGNPNPYNITGQAINVAGGGAPSMAANAPQTAIGQARVAVLEAAIPKLHTLFTLNPALRKKAAEHLETLNLSNWHITKQAIISQSADISLTNLDTFITHIVGNAGGGHHITITNQAVNHNHANGIVPGGLNQMNQDDAKTAVGQARVAQLELYFPTLLPSLFRANPKLREAVATNMQARPQIPDWLGYKRTMLIATADLDTVNLANSKTTFAEIMSGCDIKLTFNAAADHAKGQISDTDLKNAIGDARLSLLERMLPELQTFFALNSDLRLLAVARLINWPLDEWRSYKNKIITTTADLDVAATAPDAFITQILGNAHAVPAAAPANPHPFNITGKGVAQGNGAGQMLTADAVHAIGQARVAVLISLMPQLERFFIVNPDFKTAAATNLEGWSQTEWRNRLQSFTTIVANLSTAPADIATSAATFIDILGDNAHHAALAAHADDFSIIDDTVTTTPNAVAAAHEISHDDILRAIGAARVAELERLFPAIKEFFIQDKAFAKKDEPSSVRHTAVKRLQSWSTAEWTKYKQQIIDVTANIDASTNTPAAQLAAAQKFVEILGAVPRKSLVTPAKPHNYSIVGQEIAVNSTANVVPKQFKQNDAKLAIGQARVTQLEQAIPELVAFFRNNPDQRKDAAANFAAMAPMAWHANKQYVIDTAIDINPINAANAATAFVNLLNSNSVTGGVTPITAVHPGPAAANQILQADAVTAIGNARLTKFAEQEPYFVEWLRAHPARLAQALASINACTDYAQTEIYLKNIVRRINGAPDENGVRGVFGLGAALGGGAPNRQLLAAAVTHNNANLAFRLTDPEALHLQAVCDINLSKDRTELAEILKEHKTAVVAALRNPATAAAARNAIEKLSTVNRGADGIIGLKAPGGGIEQEFKNLGITPFSGAVKEQAQALQGELRRLQLLELAKEAKHQPFVELLTNPPPPVTLHSINRELGINAGLRSTTLLAKQIMDPAVRENNLKILLKNISPQLDDTATQPIFAENARRNAYKDIQHMGFRHLLTMSPSWNPNAPLTPTEVTRVNKAFQALTTGTPPPTDLTVLHGELELIRRGLGNLLCNAGGVLTAKAQTIIPQLDTFANVVKEQKRVEALRSLRRSVALQEYLREHKDAVNFDHTDAKEINIYLAKNINGNRAALNQHLNNSVPHLTGQNIDVPEEVFSQMQKERAHFFRDAYEEDDFNNGMIKLANEFHEMQTASGIKHVMIDEKSDLSLTMADPTINTSSAVTAILKKLNISTTPPYTPDPLLIDPLVFGNWQDRRDPLALKALQELETQFTLQLKTLTNDLQRNREEVEKYKLMEQALGSKSSDKDLIKEITDSLNLENVRQAEQKYSDGFNLTRAPGKEAAERVAMMKELRSQIEEMRKHTETGIIEKEILCDALTDFKNKARAAITRNETKNLADLTPGRKVLSAVGGKVQYYDKSTGNEVNVDWKTGAITAGGPLTLSASITDKFNTPAKGQKMLTTVTELAAVDERIIIEIDFGQTTGQLLHISNTGLDVTIAPTRGREEDAAVERVEQLKALAGSADGYIKTVTFNGLPTVDRDGVALDKATVMENNKQQLMVLRIKGIPVINLCFNIEQYYNNKRKPDGTYEYRDNNMFNNFFSEPKRLSTEECNALFNTECAKLKESMANSNLNTNPMIDNPVEVERLRKTLELRSEKSEQDHQRVEIKYSKG